MVYYTAENAPHLVDMHVFAILHAKALSILILVAYISHCINSGPGNFVIKVLFILSRYNRGFW